MNKAAQFLFGAFCFAASSVSAIAAEELIVNVDETMLVKTASKPGTIVIGAPGFVDATLEGGRIFIQGKSFGSTNLIILDAQGNEIANYAVTVRQGRNNGLAMYKAGERYSYTCTPDCEVATQVGDNSGYLGTVLGSSNAKQAFASGTTSQDSASSNGSNPPGSPAN